MGYRMRGSRGTGSLILREAGVEGTPLGREGVALLILSSLPGVGPVRVLALLRRYGSASAALRAPRREVEAALGRDAERARRSPELEVRARRAMASARECGAEFIALGDRRYPARLLHLAQPPPFLFVRGDPTLLGRPMIAVVGSRRSTSGGRRAAALIAEGIVRGGVVVGSGLALGIDGAAHRATLEAGGRTLAVLGAGIDVPHPPSHRALFARIAENGLLISEFVPGTPPLAHHFPRRNRILAALAEGVVVVEAARRSGALITADLALELGREVLSVPGSILNPQSVGANLLIRAGAVPIVEPDDVVGLVPTARPVEAATRSAGGGSGASLGNLGILESMGRDERSIWDALSGTLLTDEVIRAAGLPPPRALAALAALELSGWVVRTEGGGFCRASPTG